jgi:hypothetical protein
MKLIESSFWKATLFAGSLAVMTGGADAATAPYRYYRFLPTKLRDNPQIANSIQMAEFQFILNGTPLPTAGATVSNPGGNNPAGQDPPKVFDGLTSDKYLDFTRTAPLDFDLGSAKSIDSYNFATGDDAPERDPVSWVLYGSNDDSTWIPLDIRTDYAGDPAARSAFQVNPFVVPAALDPVITRYDSDLTVILNGQSTTLNWHIDSADVVSINQGIGAVDPIGSKVVTPPGDSVTTYTISGTNNTKGTTTTASVSIKTVAGGAVTYRYVRFTPVHLRDDAAANSVQLADLYFEIGGNPIAFPALAKATNPGGSNDASNPTANAAEGPMSAIDGLLGTKWLDFNKKPLVIDFSVPTTFDSYVLNTANDSIERDPVQWLLEGSTDGTNFTIIDDMTKFNFPLPIGRGVDTQAIPLPGSSLAAPIGSFSADAPTLVSGQSAILAWSTAQATSVTIDNGIGTVPVSGSFTVSPTVTTTYTLTAHKTGSPDNTAQVTITVINPANTTINYPTFDNAGPELITLGDSSVLNDFANRTLPGNFDRLRLTEDVAGKVGAAWFAKRIDFSQGFDTSFDLSFIGLNPNDIGGADGIGFTIQNVSNSLIPPSPQDKGFATKSFTVNFDSYINTPEVSAATVQIVTNGTVADLIDLPSQFPTVLGSTGTPAAPVSDLTQTTGNAAPYHVRVTYGSGKLNVYMTSVVDGSVVHILTDYAVDLSALGAVDSAGTGYVGFSSRTGSAFEAHDVTAWTLTPGAPGVTTGPLAITSYTVNAAAGTGTLNWSSATGKTYRITGSSDLISWSPLKTAIASGGTTTSSTFTFTPGTKGFFRVEQE